MFPGSKVRWIVLAMAASPVWAQSLPAKRPEAAPYAVPAWTELLPAGVTDLRLALQRYGTDERTLESFYRQPLSPTADARRRQFYEAWRTALAQVDFERLSVDGRVDFTAFRVQLDHRIRQGEQQGARLAEMAPLLPFAPTIVALREARERVEPVEPREAADRLVQAAKQAQEMIQWVNQPKTGDAKYKASVALRAAAAVEKLQESLKEWYTFYANYDPAFTWWLAEPYQRMNATLSTYRAALREKLAGLRKDDRDTIVGDPIGSAALASELASEMIPYTPEEILAIGERELAWCEAEMKKASREMGFGDDWKQALEKVKTKHVAPGEQPAMILGLAMEAVEFLEKRDLITVPPFARDTWRMDMMSPERQRINPFFTGGEEITVSYPTDGMTHEQKLMSMRGNNLHFSRATVQHELIPGHNLQYFMLARYRTDRSVFRTPFWMEGWALYWEMLLWDLGFPQTPEDRIGMLFWRMHRCARILSSFGFHLEKMSAQECVDFLVNRVGHERENAAAEVRRSFETSYEPLYQAAYMLGGLQFRALHKELVGGGKMSNRQFHDAILRLNRLPVELVRATLTGTKLPKNYQTNWRF